MAIGTAGNTNYGPPLVNQKYKPLDMVVNETDLAIYRGLLSNRSKLLRGLGLLPQPLQLAVHDWTTTIASESYMNPPLVVLSSNRSSWIKTGFEIAAKVKADRGRAFQNPSDLHAVYEPPPELPPPPPPPDHPVPPPKYSASPPIYTPLRLGNAGPRNVYIVVHISEYATYKKTLEGTGVTIVGWEFRSPSAAPRGIALAGFGASRFAAIEFCKYLRNRAPKIGGNPPWNYVWLIDDNVVALSLFPGFRAVETALAAAGTGHACAGFTGGSGAHSRANNVAWAADQIRGGWGRQAAALPASATPGLLQQMVLWNLDYLTRQHLNFSPVFIASGEDVSIGNYFNRFPTPYLFYSGITIRKENTTNDDPKSTKKLEATKARLTALFTQVESVDPPGGTPPPPILVDAGADGGVQLLADFVVRRVLPNSRMREEAENVGTQNNAKSHAVEQMICDAIQEGFMTPELLTDAFQINGTREDSYQVVNPINRLK